MKPVQFRHDGQEFFFTGKVGTHLATGYESREMQAEDGTRLWLALVPRKGGRFVAKVVECDRCGELH